MSCLPPEPTAGPGQSWRRSARKLGIATGNLAAMTVHLAVLGICMGALALAVGAGTGLRGPTFAVTAVVAVLGYFANTLAAQQDATAWLQKLSPFFC